MPEVHPGTDVEIPSGIPRSAFRVAIPNARRYMKSNRWDLQDITRACTEGDYAQLEMLLATGDENNLFNGDLNEHLNNMTALQYAAQSGHAECVALLLKAKADVHMKESMKFGQDPDDGRTALDFAKECDWEDCVELLETAQKEQKYGWYIPVGPTNNMKQYGCWEWGDKAPPKAWFLSRPGAARMQGLDPKKYGAEDFPEADEEIIAGAAPAALAPAAPAQPPIPVGLLFPGQGSQYVKMMSGVKDLPAVKEMLAKAQEILGYDILELCLKGPEAKLELTKFCQPAMYIGGLAALEKLRADKPERVERCQAVAGLSLGEYTALTAAGVFDFETGLRIVKLRGEAMQEAAEASPQSMLSVAGLSQEQLTALCQESCTSPGDVCQIANFLFPAGFSCAGSAPAVEALMKKAMKTEGCLQAKLLKTSGGFHTSLMLPAKEKLLKALRDVEKDMKPPRCDVYMNVTGHRITPATNPSAIIEMLGEQLVSCVQWEPCMREMLRDGLTEFYECGPMKQLKSMMKRIDVTAFKSTTTCDV